MRIEFNTSRPLNLYYLLYSLLKGRHPELKELFLAKYGSLKEEARLIEQFSKIRGRFRACCMLSYDEKSLLKNIEKKSSKEFKTFARELVFEFYKKSVDIFEEFMPRLEKRTKLLRDKFVKRKTKINSIIDEIKTLYGVKKLPKIVKIIVAINLSRNGHSFGEDPMDPLDYLILGPYNLLSDGNFVDHDMAIVFHELSHVVEDRSPIWSKKAEKSSLKNWKKITKKYNLTEEERTQFINEAIADNLFPDGYIALKYGLITSKEFERNINRPKKDTRDILGEKIRERTIQQIKDGKSFFEEDYLEYVCLKLREICPEK